MIMRIKELREQNNMRQIDLAASMGVSQSTVAEWDKELYLPKTRQLPLLANVLNCTIEELYNPEALRIRDDNLPFEILC